MTITTMLLLILPQAAAPDLTPVELTDKQIQQICEATATTLQTQAVALWVDYNRSRDRDQRIQIREQLDALKAGKIALHPQAADGIVHFRSDKQHLDNQAKPEPRHLAYRTELLSIAGPAEVLVTATYRTNGGTTSEERIWITGHDTSNLTSDGNLIKFDAYYVEQPPKDYTTVLGATERVRHLRLVDTSKLEQAWADYFDRNLAPTIDEVIDDARTEARRRSR